MALNSIHSGRNNKRLKPPSARRSENPNNVSLKSQARLVKDVPSYNQDPGLKQHSSSPKEGPNHKDLAQNETRDFSPQQGRASSGWEPPRQPGRAEKDKSFLGEWIWRDSEAHRYTFIGIFFFTLILYFRPYDWIPALKGLDSIAFIVAIISLLLYFPSQFVAGGKFSIFTTEVKCILFLAIFALLTVPLAKNPATAWKVFSETFIKVVIIFLLIVNVVRSRARLLSLMWLSIGVGVFLSYQAILLYQSGVFKTEGYRVRVDFGGMFGNPNDMAIHFVMFTPLAIALGVASRRILARSVYFLSAGLMIVGTMVTQSRGGFLGLIALGMTLVWKFGKKHRLRTVLIASVVTIVFISVTPGTYGVRIASIFVPSLDPVGSNDQRREALERSLVVTLRNPIGIGIGNSPIFGVQAHETHNAFTQVSSELGWLAFIAYLTFLISPLRKLSAIERLECQDHKGSWMYYVSVGLQASIIGYMVSSFFGSVAYQWYIYYVVAYALCLRGIYHLLPVSGEGGIVNGQIQFPRLEEA